MTSSEPGSRTLSFVLWIDSAARDTAGGRELGGVVEHVATSTRQRFASLSALRAFLEEACRELEAADDLEKEDRP